MSFLREEKTTEDRSLARKPFEELIKLGQCIRLEYGPDNPNNEIQHIRAIVDRERVIYRVWILDKRHWKYGIEKIDYLKMLYDEGVLKDA